jgi:hypothetical protein
VTEPSEYAREIESYLCRKNKGHLIRVVGPAFDLVCGWAQTGVPLKVAFRGIDRCCERYVARPGARRRPVRIEFCEADVLDVFDEWRRAVGVTSAAIENAGDDAAAPARKPALASHIERVIARLAHVRGVGAAATPLQHRIDEIIRELETAVAGATQLRGAARAAIVARLAELDRQLMTTAVDQLDGSREEQLRAEASDELRAFAARMAPDARARATQAAFVRLVRDNAGLPTLTYE